MKTTDEQVKELIWMVLPHIDGWKSNEKTKIASLIAINFVNKINDMIVISTPKDDPYANLMTLEYWEEVKQKLLKKSKE